MLRPLAAFIFSFYLVAAPDSKPFDSWFSPSGKLKAESFFIDPDTPRTVYLFDPEKPEKREVLCSYVRNAQLLFSPDEQWIAMSDNYGSDGTEIRLFHREGGLKFKERKVDTWNAPWRLLRRTQRVPYPKGLSHIYAVPREWSNDSNALLISLTGHEDMDHYVDSWFCVLNLKTQVATLDLEQMNVGTVVGPREGAPPTSGEQTLSSTVNHAAAKVLAAVRRDKLYPSVPSKCLMADLEEETIGYFLFAVRYDGSCCGVRTESNLLDRFAVLKPTGEIVYWDVSDPASFKPYSTRLHNGTKPR
ncbi:hypothetical protein [Geothrix sp. 21YS21S-2]|uniref:hypothetical protein n=1 Tax=Geothrix sp. 21YS21S-2 TaxID=3068893 RepID=UPI0027BACDDF|nr:hypothetical protein [Geothrix sp. 21YS21S-2]